MVCPSTMHLPSRCLPYACRAVEDKGRGFGSSPTPSPSTGTKSEPRKEDKRWQLKAASTEEWEAWMEEQKKAAGVKGDDVYVQAWPFIPDMLLEFWPDISPVCAYALCIVFCHLCRSFCRANIETSSGHFCQLAQERSGSNWGTLQSSDMLGDAGGP